MNVLIVEDEPFAQQELKRLLAEIRSDCVVLGCTDTIVDTVQWLRTNSLPDLMFLDIQLADGLSFEIFRQQKVLCPVIFTTAFDEYAIQAFKVNSIDYLLKPVKKDDLAEALARLDEIRKSYRDGQQQTFDAGLLEKILSRQNREYKARFIARLGDQIKHIPVEEIAWFFAEDNVVFMVTVSGSRFIVDYTLDQVILQVDPARFFRINRSYVASIGSIGKVSRYFNGRLLLELTPSTQGQVFVSRAKAGEFIDWLDK